MYRRAYLAATGTLLGAGTVGCLSAAVPSKSLGETVSSEYGDFSVDTVDAQQSVVTTSGASPRVRNEPKRYVLIFGCNAAGSISDDDKRRLKGNVDVQLRGSNSARVSLADLRVAPEGVTLSEEFYLLFLLDQSKTSFGQMTLRYRSQSYKHRWDFAEILPDSIPNYAEDQPNFEVRDFRVPQSATGRSAEVSVTVAETAGADLSEPEPFNVTLCSTREQDTPAYGIPVGGGETVTETFTVALGTRPDRRPDDETIRLGWGRDSRSRQITVE